MSGKFAEVVVKANKTKQLPKPRQFPSNGNIQVRWKFVMDKCSKGRHKECPGKLEADAFTSITCKCPCHARAEEE